MRHTTLFSARRAALCATFGCCLGSALGQGIPGIAPLVGSPLADPPKTIMNATPSEGQIAFVAKWLVINGRIHSGELLKDAGGYVFKTGGITARLSDGDVQVVADSREGLFAERRKRIDDKDFAERIELARWGVLHNMTAVATAEVEAVLKVAPQFEPARKLQKTMRDRKRLIVVENDQQGGGGGNLDAVVGGFGEDSLKLFTKNVHLILINKCGKCHANPRHDSAFRMAPTRHITSSVTQRNFQAAEAMCDLRNPAKSRLLEMAITPHGDAKRPQAPFGGPRDPAYQSLRSWVFSLAKNWQEGFSEDVAPEEIAGVDHAPAKRPVAVASREPGGTKSKMKPAPNQPGFGAVADDAPKSKPETMPGKQRPSPTFGGAPPKSVPAQPPKKSGPALDPYAPAAFNGDDDPLTPTAKAPPPAKIPPAKNPASGSSGSLYDPSPWKPAGKSE